MDSAPFQCARVNPWILRLHNIRLVLYKERSFYNSLYQTPNPMIMRTSIFKCNYCVLFPLSALKMQIFKTSALQMQMDGEASPSSCPKYYCNVIHSSHSLFSPVSFPK